MFTATSAMGSWTLLWIWVPARPKDSRCFQEHKVNSRDWQPRAIDDIPCRSGNLAGRPDSLFSFARQDISWSRPNPL